MREGRYLISGEVDGETKFISQVIIELRLGQTLFGGLGAFQLCRSHVGSGPSRTRNQEMED